MLVKSWQLQDAKARFSQVVRSAQTEGPQEVSLHGEPAAVVLSIDDYRRLTRRKPSFVELLRSSPLVGAELKITRSKDTVRPVKL